MEPTQVTVISDKRWLLGFDTAVEVINACVKHKSHTNAQTARVLNEAFTILAEELNKARHDLCPPSPSTNPMTTSNSSS